MKTETLEYNNTNSEIEKIYIYELDKLSLDEEELCKRAFESEI